MTVAVASRRRLLVGICAIAGLLLVAAANVHLVSASLTSQPECVPHLKAPGEGGHFRAAKSSC